MTCAAGNQTWFAYDALGDQALSYKLWINPAAGQPNRWVGTTTTFDADGRPTATANNTYIAVANSDGTYSLPANLNSSGNREVNATLYVLNGVQDSVAASTTAYNVAGQVSVTTDQYGRQTQNFYDVNNNVVKTINANGTVVLSVYDLMNRVIWQTDPFDPTSSAPVLATHTIYNSLGQVSATERYSGTDIGITGSDPVYTSTLVPNDQSSLISTTSTVYNAQGQVAETTNAAGLRTGTVYYGDGEVRYTGPLNTVVDAATGATVAPVGGPYNLIYVSDASGNLTDVYQPPVPDPNNGGALTRPHTHYGYDQEGDETAQTDANNDTTNFTFDQNGDELTRTLPDGEEESFTYNVNNQVATHTDFDGNTAVYTYYGGSGANAGALEEVVYGAAASSGKTPETVTYTYTTLGQQATVSDSAEATAADPTGTTTVSYDPEGDVTEQDTPEGDIKHTYSPVTGELTETSTANTDIAYGYNNLGELTTTTVNELDGQELSTPLVTTDAYDLAGNKTKETLPNGVVTSWADDDLNRLVSMSETLNDTTLFSQTFTLNDDGTRASSDQSQLQPDGSTITTDTTWSNNALGELTSETLSSTSNPGLDYTDIFKYDLVGNRLTSAHTGPGNGADENITNTYNGDDELTKEVSTLSGETDLEYDPNGSLTSQTNGSNVTTYVYDVRNKMISADVSGVSATYVYDDAGNRVGETTGGVTTFYLTDDDNPTGYAQPIEQKASAAAAPSVTYIIGDRVLAQTDGSGDVSYLLTDGHGSTRALTSATGAVTQAFSYSAFGGAVGFDPTTAGTSVLYTGQQLDAKSGLYYLRARYYAPSNGEFAASDSRRSAAGDLANANLYLYVDENPMNMADPTGHDGLAETMAATGIANMINGLEFTAFSAVHQAVRGAVLGESANQVVVDFLVSQALQVGAMVGLAGLGSIAADLRDGSLFASDIFQNGEGPLANAAASDAIGGLAPITPLAADAPTSPEIVNAINGGGRVARGEENCVACSIALELHFRGTPASALPGAGPSLGDELVQLAGNDFTDVSSAADLTGAFQGFGDGARGIAVYRLPVGKMHAINVINSGGRVWCIDAQAGGEAVLDGITDVSYVRTN